MNMKKLLMAGFALMAAACTSPRVVVEIENTSDVDRDYETVELAWNDLSIDGLTPENVVVSDCGGAQIPSQVIYEGETPAALIFQVSAGAGESTQVIVAHGVREEYPALVYGRYVPERLDDYAWENNKMAFRAYGPALETAPGEMLATPGFDTWVKSVEYPVIDLRYKRGNYHHDYGDGMDCYKVGRTLGAGASAPYVDGKLWLSRNYVTYETLANGPVRTAVRLTYGAFDVNGQEVSVVKTITLDANRHFNRIENVYTGDFTTLPVAAGFVRHNIKELQSGEGWLAFREEASDTQDPEADGDIFGAVVAAGSRIETEADGHAVAVVDVKPGEPMIYYAGTGWSKGDIASTDQWIALANEQASAIREPLRISVKK